MILDKFSGLGQKFILKLVDDPRVVKCDVIHHISMSKSHVNISYRELHVPDTEIISIELNDDDKQLMMQHFRRLIYLLYVTNTLDTEITDQQITEYVEHANNGKVSFDA